MKIRVIWPGKTQEEWIRRGIDEYAGRIRRYVQLDLAEAREEKGGSAETMREREGERLARLVPK
ncbi:MAG TPA: 23S rRNA (pseudouridine(1915)-N(3))-methyltransferase RlmH, partial [Geobacteraceae bacterium]|nr:23S rRNA (pseudouridine(1915)-N(3))-methyltransferase RlmH [Geobacteraceae bacterium]